MTIDDDDHRENRRNRDPGTSHEAARTIHSPDIDRVIAWLDDHDRPAGWIPYELALALGWEPPRAWRRASDARKLRGRAVWAAEPGGKLRKRPGPTGRPQQAIRSALCAARQCGLPLEEVQRLQRELERRERDGED